jgi:two-component system phosphate regulon sensor histidine kinase PhoR
MRRSLFLKLFGGVFLIIVILVALILFVSIRNIRSHYLDTMAQSLEKLGASLKPQVMLYLEQGRVEELDRWAKDLGREIDTRITLVDLEGIVLADSDEEPCAMVNHRYRPEIAAAFEGRVGRSLRFSNTVKADMLYIGLPLETEVAAAHVLRLSLYVRNIDMLLSDLTRIIWLLGLVMTVAALLAAYLVTRTLTRPLNEISRASRQVAGGDFSAKLSLVRRDELGEVARSFNFMTERVQTLFDELTRQKEELDSIISSINEGILALDREGRILFSNEAFQKLVRTEDPSQKFFWEIVRKQKFTDLIKRVQQDQLSLSEEIEFDTQVYLCNASYLDNREEVVVTFYDITQIKNIEIMKKDFVDSVSHELNTPLAAIKGFVETLEEEADDAQRGYLDIIKRNTDRLINIVQDLLALSELEEKTLELQREPVDIRRLLENILQIYKQPLQNKNLKLEFVPDAGPAEVVGDPFKLEQLFVNLIDNAVKYTEAGKIKVEIRREDGALVVDVEDSGIGIPKDQQMRIFERFYVIDKSRSKKVGGTGLGLSIVKHIAQSHEADIAVMSKPGEGTTFRITFPPYQQ